MNRDLNNPFASNDAASVQPDASATVGSLVYPPRKTSISNAFGWFENSISLTKAHMFSWLKLFGIAAIALIALGVVLFLFNLMGLGILTAIIGFLLYFGLALSAFHISVGVFNTIHQSHLTQKVEYSNLFIGFNSKNFFRLLGYLLIGLLAYAALSIVIFIMYGLIFSIMYLSSFITALLSIPLAIVAIAGVLLITPFVTALFSFGPLLAVAYDMPIIDSCKHAISGVRRNFIPLFVRILIASSITAVIIYVPMLVFGLSFVISSASAAMNFSTTGMVTYGVIAAVSIVPVAIIAILSAILINASSVYYAFRSIFLASENESAHS